MVTVELPPALAQDARALALRYLAEAQRFSLSEWVTLLEGFSALGDATVRYGEEAATFRAFYERIIDDAYGDPFITDLFAETDVAGRAPTIQAGYARQIYRRLRDEPFSLGSPPDSKFLLAYCLYWWASFARGYAMELEVFRDLEAASVPFTAHDLRVREERRSPCDLTVLGMTGDVKSTTYFLYVARSFPLTCDLYITRIYRPSTRGYLRIVLLTRQAWEQIDGETVAVELSQVADLLPRVAGITFLGYDLVIAEYEIWKQMVLLRQQERMDLSDPG